MKRFAIAGAIAVSLAGAGSGAYASVLTFEEPELAIVYESPGCHDGIRFGPCFTVALLAIGLIGLVLRRYGRKQRG
jgi:hypothetical protein